MSEIPRWTGECVIISETPEYKATEKRILDGMYVHRFIKDYTILDLLIRGYVSLPEINARIDQMREIGRYDHADLLRRMGE